MALVSGRPKDIRFNHINQISFRVASVEDLQAIWRKVKDEPASRPAADGSRQRLVALFRDPEGNRLEVFCDTDWYISQPCLEDLDLSQPAGRNLGQVRRVLPNSLGFRPIAEYQAELAEKMGLRRS